MIKEQPVSDTQEHHTISQMFQHEITKKSSSAILHHNIFNIYSHVKLPITIIHGNNTCFCMKIVTQSHKLVHGLTNNTQSQSLNVFLHVM